MESGRYPLIMPFITYGAVAMLWMLPERIYAYTNCTASITEVVPFMGSVPTLGTNPILGFSTTDAIGFPIVIDWATSVIAMGRVQQLKREGKSLPPGAAVDKDGNETLDPHQVSALKPFGHTKDMGYRSSMK